MSRPPAGWRELADIVDELQLDVDAEEIHGSILGMICCGEADGIDEDRISAIAGARHLPDEDFARFAETVRHLVSAVTVTLESGGFEFTLPLPDDSTPISTRTDAMASWCRGFVLGFFGAETRTLDTLPADAAEALRDIMEIAEAEPGEDEEEAQEAAFAEIVEYLRVSVQLIYEELNPAPSSDQ